MTARVVLITGAAGAIGSATARAFAATGATLALADSDAAALDASAQALAAETTVTGTRLDVREKAAIDAWVAAARDRFGRIDVLVNVAGITSRGSAADLAEAEWQRVIDINLKGTFLCCQAVMPAMIAQRSGHIVNIGSVLGKNGGNARPWIAPAEQAGSGNVAYGISKAGVHAMTAYLAKELAAHGVRVNAVAPGPVESAMTVGSPASRAEIIPLGRRGHAEEVAAAVVFLASGGASFITGEVLDVNGGLWCD